VLIRHSETTPIQANSGSNIWDYELPGKETGLSYQKLNGRLPEKGWYKNTVCREFFFVINGKGTIHIENESHKIGKGDVVVLEPTQKHYGEYDNVTLITITIPDWYEGQCEIVEQ